MKTICWIALIWCVAVVLLVVVAIIRGYLARRQTIKEADEQARKNVWRGAAGHGAEVARKEAAKRKL